MTRAQAARRNGKKGGRPPGKPSRRSFEVRLLEEQALVSVLGGGDRERAAKKVIGWIHEFADGEPKGPDGRALRVSAKERLQARMWLGERLFGHLPQPAKYDGDQDPVVLVVHHHKDAPPA